MNKKAGERVLFVYWLIIIVIITLGIVSGVLHVVGSSVDIRKAEAVLLKDKLVECLAFQGELNSAFFDLEDDKESLLRICKIDLQDKTQKYKGTEQYAISLELYDFNKNFMEKKEFGNPAFFETCDLKGNFPVCVEKEIYVLDKGGGKFLKIKTAVDKGEKNVE